MTLSARNCQLKRPRPANYMPEDGSDRTWREAGDMNRRISTTLSIAVSTKVRGQGGSLHLKRDDWFSKNLN